MAHEPDTIQGTETPVRRTGNRVTGNREDGRPPFRLLPLVVVATGVMLHLCLLFACEEAGFADPRVEANRGKLARERGPVVYCFEEIDNPVSFESASLSSTFRSEMREDLLGGVVTLTDDSLAAVPYFAWANRGSGRMRVWVPDSPEV